MVGVELAVGYLFAWAVGKARRVAGRVDAEVDQALDAGMDHLHEVVVSRLGADEPALERIREEAGSGLAEPTARTREQLELALEQAAARDTGFAAALRLAVEAVAAGARAAAGAGRGGEAVSGNTFNGPTALVVGDHARQDNHFGPS
ncbi:hypothetical protein [Kitasatospora sp. NPDC056184]|uniref:hypothetical protein n=1 Tax=Kitasatospora sp. NPDC056184 TaxID=3345738 RepID=UPI0035DE1488